MIIQVKKFKGIDDGVVELDDITVFVGTNNAGKSSFIQAIQFAVSGCQTLDLKSVPWRTQQSVRTTSLNSEEFLYTPTRNIETLYHNERLTERTGPIAIKFTSEVDESEITFSKGRNKGITTKLTNKPLGEMLCDVGNPYCVYVPGIAGIPIEEVYEPEIKVRKSAIRGDSNNFLRNILLRINRNEDSTNWDRLIKSLNNIYEGINLYVTYDEIVSEFITCRIIFDDYSLPLDSVGTGLLQSIQIFAYMEYFSPKILLLDEPDSHLHPTKQRLLAEEIQRRAIENTDMKVVFSTHSMQLLRSLSRAKTYHFINGKPTLTDDESAILLDIGALDADYLFSKPHLEYVLITEDKVDDIKNKISFIKHLLIGNGLNENQFVLHSYNGCKNMHTAGVLQGLIRKHAPAAKVIVHIDKDQRWTENEPDINIMRHKALVHEVGLFVTKFSEIENYFCQPSHISNVFDIDILDAQRIYNDSLEDCRLETVRKLKDFILNDRRELVTENGNRISTAKLDQIAEDAIREHFEHLVPGKELLAAVKNRLLQGGFRIRNINNLVTQPSIGLRSQGLLELLNNEEE